MKKVRSIGNGLLGLWLASLLVPVLIFLVSCNRNPAAKRQNFMERGDKYFTEKRYGEAVIEYKNALRVDPSYGDGYHRLGLALLQQGQWSKAAESFSRALQFTPDNLDARLRLGDILAAAGEYEDAHAQADEVMKRDPQNANVHLLLGQIELQQKKFKEAEAEFRQASLLAPDQAVPYGNMGLSELLSGNYEAAEKNFQKAKELDPSDPQFVLNWANFYRSRQRPDRAEQVLRQALAENPKAIEIPLALADLYVTQGRVADARRTLDDTESNDKSYPEASRKVADFYYLHNDIPPALERFLKLAEKHSSDKSLGESVIQCYLELGRWQDAEHWIDKEDKKDQEPAFRLLRARVHIGEYQLRDAISELQSIIQAEPGNILALYYLAQADMQRGDLEAAKAALVDALRVQPGYNSALLGLGDISLQQRDASIAMTYANQILTHSYWVVEAHLLLGNAYILRNNLNAALQEFQVAASLNPHNAGAQERIGRVFSAQGKYADAERAYESALSSDPGNGLALAGLAENLVAQGKAEQAFARINQQSERQPNAYRVQIVRGEFCMTRSNWECSQQSFRKAIELNPYDANVYVSLARVYAATNRVEDMVREYEQARQKFPEYLPTYMQLARIYQDRGEFEKAKQTYQQALLINANYVPALNSLAWMYCEHNGPLNEALELAQQAKRGKPDDPHVNDTLAWVYYRKGMYPSALDLLESVVAQNPKDPTFQYHLGMVYLNMGRQDQGRRVLQAALRGGLNSQEAKAAREALQ